MPSKALREKVNLLQIDPQSRYALLRSLILDGFFDRPVSSEQVVHRVREKFGKRWKTSHIQPYMQKFMKAGIIHAVKPQGTAQNFWTLASVRRENAINLIGKTRKVIELEQRLFSETVLKKLKKNFGTEILNYMTILVGTETAPRFYSEKPSKNCLLSYSQKTDGINF